MPPNIKPDLINLNEEPIIYLYSRVPFLAQRGSQILNATFFDYTAPRKITVPQYHLLHLLEIGGPSSQADLARKAGGDRATIGVILRNIIRDGLVKRHVDPLDARRKIVGLTTAGHEMLDAAIKADHVICERLKDRLGSDAVLLDSYLDLVLAENSDGAESSHTKLAVKHGSPRPMRSLILKMRLFQQLNERSLADAVGMLGLTARQFTMLYVMLAIPNLNRSDAVRITGSEGSNAALVIKLLLDKGLIEPANKLSKRRFRVSLAGAKLLAASHLLAMEAEAALTKNWSSVDIVTLQRLLGRVIREFDGEMRQPMPAFVAVQAQEKWPMKVAPAPSLMLQIRKVLAE